MFGPLDVLSILFNLSGIVQNHTGSLFVISLTKGFLSTAVWGKLIAYDPGRYLAFSWFPGRDESEATVVEVQFTQTEAGTRCDLTHGGFDILGPTADAVSTSYLTGWDLVLGCYASAAKQPALT